MRNNSFSTDEWMLTPCDRIKNGRNFADEIFKCILLNENFCILNEISLKYVPQTLIKSIVSDNVLAPNSRQAMIETNDG